MHHNEYTKATKSFALFTLAISLPLPMFAKYVKDFGLTDMQLSWFFSLLPLCMFILSPIVGKVSDKLGRNFILSWSILLQICGVFLYMFTDSVPFLILARILDVIAIAIITTVVLAKIEDNIKEKERGSKSGLSFSIQSLGRILGPVIGGFLADYLFIKSPFFAMLLFLVMIFTLPKKEHKKKKVSKKDFSWFADVKEFLSYVQLRGMSIMGIVFHASTPAINVFLPLLIIENLGLNYVQVGIALFVLQITHIFQFIFGKWSNSQPHKYVALGSLISGLCFIAIFFVQSYYQLLFVLFIKGIGNSIWNVSAWTLMSKIGEKHKIEGEVVGSYISIAKLGAFFSFLLSGWIVMVLGIKSLFAINGMLILLGIAFAFRMLKVKAMKVKV